MSFTHSKLTPHTGIEISDLDLSRPVSAETYTQLRRLLVEYGVLVFRNEHIDDEAQVMFSRGFGPLEIFPNNDLNSKRHPEVMAVVDVGDTTSYVSVAQLWHTDGSYRQVPAYVTLLRGLEISPVGGETCFANTAAGYDALPAAMKEKIADLEAIHDLENTRSMVKGYRPFTAEERAKIPPVRHPLVKTHADTGRKYVYVANHARDIVGMSREDSITLLDEITDLVTRPEFVYEHKWQPGDLVVWDNRGTLHRVLPYDARVHRRVMHRTEVSGLAA